MRHEAEYPSRRVCKPGNGICGAVRVVRISIGNLACLVGILYDYVTPLVHERPVFRRIYNALSLTVPYRKINSIHIFCKYAMRKLIYAQADPPVLKPAGIVGSERCRLFPVPPFHGR